MSAISKWRLLYKPVLTVLQRNQLQICRFKNLHHTGQCGRSFCSASFPLDLPVDKSTLNKYVEDVWKEHDKRSDEELSGLFEKREHILKNISSLDTFEADSTDDKELKKLLEDEGRLYSEYLDKLNIEILHRNYLKLHGGHLNDDSAMLEVAAGVGGQEAMIFAGDLFKMYEMYALSQGWILEVMDVAHSDLGGLRSSVACVRGPSVYRILRCEGGVHRVQRIPQTERSGRLHTSTATVVVMPEPSEVDVTIDEKDLRIETKRPSGPGGQNAQKSDSSVRITHTPTGIVCASQEHRSAPQNIKVAMRHLRAKLYALNFGRQEADVESQRRQQEGSRMRSEKIRTYNVLQDRVTDHRWGMTVHNLPDLWSGGQTLHNLIQTCGENYEQELFKQYLSNFKYAMQRKTGRR